MDRQRLDIYDGDDMPPAIRAYLQKNGWSFSKAMCDFAVNRMKDRSGKKIEPYTREQVAKMLANAGISLKNDNGYDAVYTANMAKADHLGSALQNESQVALFVRDYIDDEDGYPGKTFTRYFADLIGAGINAPWEELA